MLNSMEKLLGQPSVRNKHESDHTLKAPVACPPLQPAKGADGTKTLPDLNRRVVHLGRANLDSK
ncbi:hypothetical protein CES85_2621 [Ochrobactrum quorumnocens]|uniref:Uncharacterized protein n=1 Tax=Ochrobactrum quorumnocens TaxID=271865 RepID=A0A248UHT0_9HYPH|nr:hypothetical protein CES85_2621 [[Ochrobactrum] quorumnocens]